MKFRMKNSIDLQGLNGWIPYLSEPLVLQFTDDLVGVPHHSDQHVDQQKRHQHHVHQEDKLQQNQHRSDNIGLVDSLVDSTFFELILPGKCFKVSRITSCIQLELLSIKLNY